MSPTLLSEYERPTAVHYRILLMSWAGWVFDFYDLVLYTFLQAQIGKELGIGTIASAWVLGGSLAATAVGGIVFGALADRFGRRAVLQWTILTYSLGAFLSGFSTCVWSLLGFRVLTGLGVGGEWATGQAYIGEAFPARMRGRFGAYMQTGAPVGIALASVVGGFLMPAIGWRGCFWVSLLPALLVVYVRKRLPESDLWLERGRPALEGSAPSTGAGQRKSTALQTLLSPAYRMLFAQCLILALLDMSAYWYTYSWMPGYLQKQRHLTIANSALWMLVMQSGGFLGYATFGYVADSLGRRPAYSIYCVLMALGLVMTTLLWDAVVAYPALLLAFMFLVGFGTGMFGGYGPLFSELFPTRIRNTAMGAAFNLARGVQFITPWVIARIAESYRLSGGISLAALFALLTGIWIWTFPETKGRRLVDLEESGPGTPLPTGAADRVNVL